MEIDRPNLGDKALSKVVEIGIAIQLDEAEVIDVDIRTNPGKLMQGKLDSLTISGKGLMRQDLRMETIEVNIGKVGINPLSAVFGNIELNFIIPGLSLQLYKLEAPLGKLVIHSQAQVVQITPIVNLL
jgi:LmeA-like phospholipid-binding